MGHRVCEHTSRGTFPPRNVTEERLLTLFGNEIAQKCRPRDFVDHDVALYAENATVVCVFAPDKSDIACLCSSDRAHSR